MGERDRMYAANPKTRYIGAHFNWYGNDLARAAKQLDALPEPGARSRRGALRLRPAAACARASSSSSTRTACCSARTPTQPAEFPVLLARVRDERRVLRLLPRLPRVLEALRHGSAGRGAEEAVLPERRCAGRPACRRPAGHDKILARATLRRHWGRGLHRLAHRRRAAEARRVGQNRRRFFQRPSREPAGRRRCDVVEGERRRPGDRASARSTAASSSSTRRRFRRCRARSPIRCGRIARTSRARSRCSSPRATPRSSGSSSPVPPRSTAMPPCCRSARTCGRPRCRPTRCRSSSASRYCQLFTQPLRSRDRHDALFQRVRTAPAAGLAVFRRDLAVHRGARQRQAADDSRRRQTDARFHLRRGRRDRRAARVRGAERRRRSHQPGRRRPHLAARTGAQSPDHPQELASSRRSARRGPATSGIHRPTSTRRANCWASIPSCRSTRACGARSRGTRAPRRPARLAAEPASRRAFQTRRSIRHSSPRSCHCSPGRAEEERPLQKIEELMGSSGICAVFWPILTTDPLWVMVRPSPTLAEKLKKSHCASRLVGAVAGVAATGEERRAATPGVRRPLDDVR